MLQELISTLTIQEKETLRERAKANDSSLFRLITAVMDDADISKEQILKRFKINENTYHKNLSLAKDEIYEVIKHHMRNSYDDMILSNVLYRRGLEVQASKLRLKLESEYDSKGWWSVLNELYSHDMMVAYAKCDISRMEQIRDKALTNADRLVKFIKVDREVIVQMAIIERGDLKEKEYGGYAENMNTLLKQARSSGNHIPVFNALHSLFVLYTKYDIDLKKAKKAITEMQLLVEEHEDKMIAYTINAAWLNLLAFHVDFVTDESPVPFFKPVSSAIGSHGLLYDTEAMLIFCVWYFWMGDKANFGKRLEQFKEMPTDKSFGYKLAYLNSLYAYLNNDARAFNQHLNEFYNDVSSRNYNDNDLMLRYLELAFLIRENNYSLASDKLDAAIKFTRRNFTSNRVEIEKKHWDMFRTVIQGKPVKAPVGKVYRLTEFLYDELRRTK